MSSRLSPCPSCSRHVKVGPPVCPFCGGDVPTTVPARSFAKAAGKPLTRAAVLFAGAAAVTACFDDSKGTEPAVDGSTQGDDAGGDNDGQAVAAYGVMAAPPDAGEPDDGGDDHDGQAIAAYGAPVQP